MSSVQYAIDILSDMVSVRERNQKFAEREGYVNHMPQGWDIQLTQMKSALDVLKKHQETVDVC